LYSTCKATVKNLAFERIRFQILSNSPRAGGTCGQARTAQAGCVQLVLLSDLIGK